MAAAQYKLPFPPASVKYFPEVKIDREIKRKYLAFPNYQALLDYLGINNIYSELPEAPSNWQTKEEMAKGTGVSPDEAEKIIAKLKKQFPEQHGKFKAKNEE